MLHPADSLQTELAPRIEKEPFLPEHDIQFYTVADNSTPWDAVPLNHHIPTSTSSDESFAFASNALRECLDNHRTCDSTASEFLPSRLVQVGGPDEPSVRVIETLGMDPIQHRYLALSHCWGPPESITAQLNDETYREYTKDIPLTLLPKTFHDAVVVTRKLGYQYLWVDSLCIIQGNIDDWIKEGSQMCSIYENSLLTLAAASSSSGHGGLFYQSPRLQLTSTHPESGQQCQIFARFNINHRFFDFPLMNRAWVMQERLLSPRTLYFTSQELVWECRSCNMCQCSPILGGFSDQIAGFPINSKLQPATADLQTSALVSKWQEVVEIYTQLNMTHASDKLMAIDGIAQYMAPIRKSQHLAGLWSDSFASDLAWTVGTFDDRRSRSLEWRAPTWSWASLETKIRWYMEEKTITSKTHFVVEKWPQPQHNGGIQWSESSQDSHLGLRGVLVGTTIAEADIVVNSSPCLYEDCAEWVPSDGHTQDDEPIYCLRLLEGEGFLCSLLLRRIDPSNENLYQRHGLLLFQGDPNKNNEIWKSRDTRSRDSSPDLKVSKLTPVIGTEIRGLQLSQLNDLQKDELALLIAERGVVVFRDQDFKDIGVEKQKEFGQYFGPLHIHDHLEFHNIYLGPDNEYRNESKLDKLNTIGYHSDVSYEHQPPGITILTLLSVPPTGGDTIWASQTAAYARLSTPIKTLLEDLRAEHSGYPQAEKARRDSKHVRREPVKSEHPIVRIHPATGQKALFIKPGFTKRIIGLKQEESDGLLKILFKEGLRHGFRITTLADRPTGVNGLESVWVPGWNCDVPVSG
ncbi:family Taurine catabolism dioxygenase [Fusarium albosuccineum]|uniref:Family Taurine catabolism dioxygenase n=1 Tax=Fusarium albosuccineum TaxID=1237068 RepID=A0A8H4P7V1_9HYPO|nr:family Taurine catabolism dioxygenase [Fusarium albosuccineum]